MTNTFECQNNEDTAVKIKPVHAICSALLLASLTASAAQAATYSPDEDVMTSGFFMGPDQVRGYVGDGRSVFRVSTPAAFGTGLETIYLDFSGTDLSAFSGPVNATLTMTSTAGTFNADAGPGNPFTVSAHGVDTDPLANIADNTGSGTIAAADFYNNNIHAADAAALTVIDGFGEFSWDVSALVNDWISGANSLQFIAMTGQNDTSGNDFLHGFFNNSDTAQDQGYTRLEVSAVPLPAAAWLFGSAVLGMIGIARRQQRAASATG